MLPHGGIHSGAGRSAALRGENGRSKGLRLWILMLREMILLLFETRLLLAEIDSAFFVEFFAGGEPSSLWPGGPLRRLPHARLTGARGTGRVFSAPSALVGLRRSGIKRGFDGNHCFFDEFCVVFGGEDGKTRNPGWRFLPGDAILKPEKRHPNRLKHKHGCQVFTFVINTFRKGRKTQVFRLFRVWDFRSRRRGETLKTGRFCAILQVELRAGERPG